MVQPPSKPREYHHHHHAQHITDPARRKKKHLPSQLAQLQLDYEGDTPNNNVSSSRDASEEDNDDQEEAFDDNASIASLRQQHQSIDSISAHDFPVSASTSSIPPSERDQVLIDSAALHQNKQTAKSTSHDRTPSSTSPPRTTSIGAAAAQIKNVGQQTQAPQPQNQLTPAYQQQQHQLLPQSRDVSSDDDYSNRMIGATLANASETLSSSSSVELLPKAMTHRGSSAGPEQPRGGKSSGLNLGTLPPAAFSASAIPANKGSGETPLAVPAALINSSAGTPLASQASDALEASPEYAVGTMSAKRKVSSSHHSSSVAARKADLKDTGDEDTNTDGGTPYDGDVEYAARTPGSMQPASTKDGTDKAVLPSAASTTPGVSAQQQDTIRNTAPEQVPYRTYIQTMGTRHADCHPDGDGLVESGFQPSSIPSAESIQQWVNDAIFHPDPSRDYSINPPSKRLDDSGRERPIRIYADGVYDLFHYAHALQMRQAKLSFPSVHLIVGVVSSHSCAKHKNKPVLSSMERYECVRNCRWVDEVLEDAPWVVDQKLIDTLEIDYIAHDDLPYSGKGMEDIYAFVKRQGRFLPTRRTDGVSTSELLGRIVEVYKDGSLDGKLAKIGLDDLTSKPLPETQGG